MGVMETGLTLLERPDQSIDCWAVVCGPLWMPQADHAIGVEHRLAAKLAKVPLARPPASSAKERTGIEPHRAEVQHGNQPPSSQTPRAVGLTLRVHPDLERGEPRLKHPCCFRGRGEGDDHHPRRRQLGLPLPQLRQMLLAGESTQVSEEDEDSWSAAQILQTAAFTAKVGEAKRGCWLAGPGRAGPSQVSAYRSAQQSIRA